MDRFDLEEVVAPSTSVAESPLKQWRLKFESGTIHKNDFIEFFQKESRKYFDFQYEYDATADEHSYRDHLKLRNRKKDGQTAGSLKCMFKEEGAREAMIDVLLEFVLGDNPNALLERLQNEGNTASVCGKVFKNGEPTYSCRECVMDPTCVLCVNCFKQSAHRFHKYKMSTSGGGGCCDCGDEEAWKKDHYCEEHLRAKENPTESTIITDAIKERCEIAFIAILSFCIKYLEIETNASLECLDGENENDNFYCTVLYNDESHTFDQVISILNKVAKSKSKDAMEIVSAIDREGRAVVKCDNFCECNQLKEAIEKHSISASALVRTTAQSQCLRVSVLHIRAVACQQFALQLLSWCQEFLIRHRVFRQVFAKVIMDKTARYNIRHILEYDVKLWKTARSCWHRLIISGLLMEYDNKMALAQEFSRNYATMMQDFIRDDHDHSFSIVSLSVQLFTVPSIAHYLIANEGILFKLLHTFYHESIESFIKNKTLHFAKNMAGLAIFKRAAYILYDLRYILAFKPDGWTENLREGFLEGCKALLRLLNAMQGMESVTRQTGQHMDYEPEWECAFNLHIKLATTISLVLEWCASDREVLTKLYGMVMRNMASNGFIVNNTKTVSRTVAGHVAHCIVYDVATRPVSMHLPLSRFFAGIYLHLGQYGLNFDNASLSSKRTPEELMEPILCTQTMIAQVHSGMWRRNGYSLLHQLYFYRNVRCRGEMLDRDIVGMQIGASLIESNEYLITILNKFGLIEWIQPDYEANLSISPTDDEFIKQLSMIDEFLELLIVVIGERYMPGISNVTEEDRTRKEIIQLLCIKSFSHSELSRALPDSNNETALESVIDSVAIFKKPQKSDAKGVYELKEELYDEYNMYFYHYTKEDKSKSEERQRLRRKNKGELVCCPPPQLPKLMEPFITIANLLQCKVMMTIISTVLSRALDLSAKSFQENHLQKVLHLIGYGLQEELTGEYPFLTFYAHSLEHNVPTLLEDLSRSPRVEAHRDFILWIIKKFKEIKSKELAEGASDNSQIESHEMTNSDADAQNEEMPLTNAEQEKKEKEERARLAAARREKIMAQMQSAQRNFMQSNAEMYASANAAALTNEAANTMDWQTEESMIGGDEEGAAAYKTVACLGVDQRLQQLEEQNFKCILCFEDCSVTKDGPTLVYSAFVQKSKVLRPESKYDFSVYTSSCGHIMHASCWQEYYSNEESKEQRRPHRHRNNASPLSHNLDFQCPYCRYLSNTVLPLTPQLSKYSQPNVIHAGEPVFPIDQWIEVLNEFTNDLIVLRRDEDIDMWHLSMPSWESVLQRVNPVSNDTTTFERMANLIEKPEIPSSWTYFIQNYVKSVRRYTPHNFELNEKEGLLWMWHSCIYTVQAMEVYLRAVDKPFKNQLSMRHESCLSGLIRACCLQSANLQQTDVRNLLEPVVDLLETLLRQGGQSVLGWNCFSMLASTIFMVPNMLFSTSNKRVLASGSMMDFYTLQLYFLANMVKAIVLFEAPVSASDSMDMDLEEEMEFLPDDIKSIPIKIQENIGNFYRKYNIPARKRAYEQAKLAKGTSVSVTDSNGVSLLSPSTYEIECNLLTITALFEHIKTEMIEFLRKCCLFFHFATDVEFPEEFEHASGNTFENMCKYLGLQTNLSIYFDNEQCYATILDMFASHNEIINCDLDKWPLSAEDYVKTIVPCSSGVPQLVSLPEDYSDLINSVSDFICPKNPREEMKSPTMCLICGEILCGQSFCCQPQLGDRTVGACTYHAHFCNANIGIFLRIRDCQVVYLGSKKGCFVQPPYLDEYGETDQGLRRGNPLRLCPERYRKIHLHWLGHGLHEEVARLTENTSMPVTQWHHM